jgi:hypothetical protein
VLGQAVLDQNGQASLALESLPDGLHTFTASYSGDDAFDTSDATVTQQTSALHVLVGSTASAAQTLGTSVTLVTLVSGGSPPYSYAWSSAGAPVAGAETLTDTPPLGVNFYEVRVTDARGCPSAGEGRIDVFDFSVQLSTSDLTLLRAGYARTTFVSLALVPGSSTEFLPSVDLRGVGAPPDLVLHDGFGGQPVFSATGGITLFVQPGSTSLGDYAVSLTATTGGGTRTIPLRVHIFDFGLAISPAQATAYRAGGPATFLVTSTVAPGSTAQRPATVSLSAGGFPFDVTYTLPPIALSGTSTLLIQPGPMTIGDFNLTVLCFPSTVCRTAPVPRSHNRTGTTSSETRAAPLRTSPIWLA